MAHTEEFFATATIVSAFDGEVLETRSGLVTVEFFTGHRIEVTAEFGDDYTITRRGEAFSMKDIDIEIREAVWSALIEFGGGRSVDLGYVEYTNVSDAA